MAELISGVEAYIGGVLNLLSEPWGWVVLIIGLLMGVTHIALNRREYASRSVSEDEFDKTIEGRVLSATYLDRIFNLYLKFFGRRGWVIAIYVVVFYFMFWPFIKRAFLD